MLGLELCSKSSRVLTNLKLLTMSGSNIEEVQMRPKQSTIAADKTRGKKTMEWLLCQSNAAASVCIHAILCWFTNAKMYSSV